MREIQDKANGFEKNPSQNLDTKRNKYIVTYICKDLNALLVVTLTTVYKSCCWTNQYCKNERSSHCWIYVH